jgi:hypothetical protein
LNTFVGPIALSTVSITLTDSSFSILESLL